MKQFITIRLVILVILCQFLDPAFSFSSLRYRLSNNLVMMKSSHHSDQCESIQTQSQAKQNMIKSSIRATIPFATAMVGFFAFKSSTQAKQPNTYLTEPTEKFQAELAKGQQYDEYRAKIKLAFQNLFKDFEAAEKPEDLIKTLTAMETYLSKINDMPTGIRKKEIVRICRAKKFIIIPNVKKPKPQPNWTEEVERAYVKLILTVDRLLAPDSAVSPSRNHS